MMLHLVEALESGRNIGHYAGWSSAWWHATSSPRTSSSPCFRRTRIATKEACGLYRQATEHDYSQPTLEWILEWQKSQDFPIAPNREDPDAANVYKASAFPKRIYEHISEHSEQKEEADRADP